MEGTWPWLLPVLGFLIGSVPFGLLIAKAKGFDIRKVGSGNIGATNVLRTIGKGPGILCLFLDLLKGFVPVILAANLLRFGPSAPWLHLDFLDGSGVILSPDRQVFVQTVHVLTALAAILGHNYSPWIGFKGGKGIATTAGVLLALMPAGVVILILIFLIVLRFTRYVSLASIVAALCLPLITVWGSWHHGKFADGTWNKPLLAFATLAGGLAVWRHRANISRLRSGTESRFGRKKTPV